MDVDISLEAVCSDLHTFLDTKKNARNEFINGLIELFQNDKNDIAAYRRGNVRPVPLAKWVFAHPACIPLLTKCLDKYNKGLLERMKTKAKEYGKGVWKINSEEGKFFKVWGTVYDNVAQETTLERLSKLEDVTKSLDDCVKSQRKILDGHELHIVEQDKTLHELKSRIEVLEKEIKRKDVQIKTLTEENEKLTVDKQELWKKIEKLKKEKKVLKESRNDLRKKLEEEKMERQAEKERLMQDNNALKKEIDDMNEQGLSSDEFDQKIVKKS